MNKSSILLLEYQDLCRFQRHMQEQPARTHKLVIENTADQHDQHVHGTFYHWHNKFRTKASPHHTACVIQKEICWIQGPRFRKTSTVHVASPVKIG